MTEYKIRLDDIYGRIFAISKGDRDVIHVKDDVRTAENLQAVVDQLNLADELAGALADLWNRVSNDTDFEEIAFSLDRARDVLERYKKIQEGE